MPDARNKKYDENNRAMCLIDKMRCLLLSLWILLMASSITKHTNKEADSVKQEVMSEAFLLYGVGGIMHISTVIATTTHVV